MTGVKASVRLLSASGGIEFFDVSIVDVQTTRFEAGEVGDQSIEFDRSVARGNARAMLTVVDIDKAGSAFGP